MAEELKTLEIKGQSVDVAELNSINLKGVEISIPKGITVSFYYYHFNNKTIAREVLTDIDYFDKDECIIAVLSPSGVNTYGLQSATFTKTNIHAVTSNHSGSSGSFEFSNIDGKLKFSYVTSAEYDFMNSTYYDLIIVRGV